MTLLPEDFQPGENDVICGRGKKCYNHIGNERFRVHVMSMLDEYSRAKSKLDKSGVLSTVVAQIRAKSTNGGFVKQDDSDRWFEVGDFLAKEKTSQAFRDALHERYKSSNVSKKKRRQEEQTRAGDRFRGITRAHSDGPGIEWLSLSSRGDASLAAARAGGQDMYHSANMDALARLNRLGDLHTASNHFDRQPQAPVRSHSSLGFSTGYSDSFGGGNNIQSGNSMQQNQGFSTFASSSMSHAPSSGAPSPLLYGSMQNRGSQEPLDAYQSSTAQNDMEMFDMISPPNHGGQFVPRSLGEQLHHSMPDLTRSNWEPVQQVVGGQRVRHNSAPDLNYYEEDDDSFGDVELDPIPLEEFTPRPSSKKTVDVDQFKKPISMTLSPNSPSVAVSADLLACLEKLNGSAITDNNPFEPLPIASNQARGGDPKLHSRMRQSAFDRLQPPLT